MNPSYYGLDTSDPDGVAVFLIGLIRQILGDLQGAGCVNIGTSGPLAAAAAAGDGNAHESATSKWQSETSITAKTSKEVLQRKLSNAKVSPTQIGRIASFYYLDFRTMAHFVAELDDPRWGARWASWDADRKFRKVLELVSDAHEFAEVPVRHNEDQLNVDLSELLPWNPYSVPTWLPDSPHGKAFLLIQAYCKRVPAPIKDYATDTKSVLDQAARVLNALIEVATHRGLAELAAAAVQLSQCLTQGRFWDDPAWAQLQPRLNPRRSRVVEKDGLLDSSLLEPVHSGVAPARSPLKASDLAGLPHLRLTATLDDYGMLKFSWVVSKYNNSLRRLPCARMAKARDHSWWIFAVREGRVVASKHLVGLPQNYSVTLPTTSGRPDRIWLLSGVLRGLDQEILL